MTEAAFDTNILIDALNDVAGAHDEIARFSQRFISRMTWIEVLAGALPDDTVRAEGFMGYFTTVELDHRIARRAADLRFQHPRLKLPDAVILASAQINGRILISRDTRDFRADMPGIHIPYTL